MESGHSATRKSFFFFNDTATTEIYTLSLHDALPIFPGPGAEAQGPRPDPVRLAGRGHPADHRADPGRRRGRRRRPPRARGRRSEEHTSELQSRQYLVCRLLLEKKKKIWTTIVYLHRS